MIETEYVHLNTLLPEDAIELHRLMNNNTIRFQRFFPMTLAQNTSVRASKEYIQRKKMENEAKKEFTWAIRDAKTSTLMGLLILKDIDWDAKVGEIAYALGGAFEGKGFTTETVKGFSSIAFNTLGLKTLRIITHSSNIGSVGVAEKCGFVWKQLLMAEHTPPGENPLDMELYEKNVSKR